MITDPYIGMPIFLGGQCKADNILKNEQMTSPLPCRECVERPLPVNDSNSSMTETASPYATCDCERAFDAEILGSLPLAMSYTPMQQWAQVYTPSEGFEAGTIFPDLNLPFRGCPLGLGGDDSWR